MQEESALARYIYNPLNDDQFRLLLGGLLKCSSMGNQATRDTIVSKLPPQIATNVSRHSTFNVDVNNILERCLQYPEGFASLISWIVTFEGRSNAVNDLYDLIRQVVGRGVVPEIHRDRLLNDLPPDLLPAEEIKTLYRKLLPRGWRYKLDSPTITAAMAELTEIPDQTSGIRYPVIAFVELVALSIKDSVIQDKIDNWLTETERLLSLAPGEMARVRAAAKNIAPTNNVKPYLLIDLSPSDPASNSFTVRAWLWLDDDEILPLDTTDSPILKDSLKEVLDELLNSCAEELQEALADLTIEFLLPRQLFCWDFDQWDVKADTSFSIKAGSRYPLVVRSNERIWGKRGSIRGYWIKKWQRLMESALQGGQWHVLTVKPDEPQDDNLFATMTLQDDVFCLILMFAPPERASCEGKDILNMAVEAGIPAALWVRNSYTSIDTLHDEIEAMLRGLGQTDLPMLVRQKRLDAFLNRDQIGIGNHLTLLWDDPKRLPDINPLRGTQRVRI